MGKMVNKLAVAAIVTVLGISSIVGFASNSIVAQAAEADDCGCNLSKVKSMYDALDRINTSLKDEKYNDIHFEDVNQVNSNATLSNLSIYTKVLSDLGAKSITEEELSLIVNLVESYGDITSEKLAPLTALKVLDTLPSSENIEHIKSLETKLTTTIKKNMPQHKPTKSLTPKLEEGLKDSKKFLDTKKFLASSADTLKYNVHAEYNEDIAFTLSYPNNKSTNADILMALKDASGQIVAISSLEKLGGESYQVLSTNIDKGNYVLEMYVLPTSDISDQTFTLSSVRNILGGLVSSATIKLSDNVTGTLVAGGLYTTLRFSAIGEHLSYRVEVKEPGSTKYVLLRDWGRKTKSFGAKKPGTYKIKVTAKNYVSEHTSSKTISIKAVKAVTPKIKSMTLSKTKVKPGEKVTVNTIATGVDLEYGYTYKNLKVQFQEFSLNEGFMTSKSLTFKAPTEKGEYEIIAWVRQHNGMPVKTPTILTVK
ncbi:hypothetical protein [Rummeliibacillus pycnus]|uniref:hypothetical protein n=1 Tax=Rummeliibacillus pycnus TaxID=101070 RepID=UPI0037CAD1C4